MAAVVKPHGAKPVSLRIAVEISGLVALHVRLEARQPEEPAIFALAFTHSIGDFHAISAIQKSKRGGGFGHWSVLHPLAGKVKTLTTHPNRSHPKEHRVLQVIPELETGGAERTTVDIAAGIVARGGRALVATHGGRLARDVQAAGGEVLLLPVHSKNPLTIIANIFRLAARIRREGINIVHVRSRAPAWSALPAARLTGARYVTTYHGTYNAKSSLKRFYNSGMARGDHVIANSAFIGDHIRKHHPGHAKHLTVIARGTDLRTHSEEAVTEGRKSALKSSWQIENNTKPLVLLPGRLTAWKGQAVLIEAVARLREKSVDDFIVILAGDPQGRDDYVKSLWDQINGAGLSDRIRMVGHCDDIPAAMALADIVVSASTEPEAFGRVAVEAQAMARPIIATDHGGAEETVVGDGPERTGWRVEPGSAEALAAALEEALALTPEERRAMGQNGRANAARFSVEAMVEATLDVYDQVLEGAP